jgi:hypothetical protein
MTTETATAATTEATTEATTAAATATETAATAATPQAATTTETKEAAATTEGTEAKTEAKTDVDPDAVPETYADFTMPEGVELDSAALEGFIPVAKDLGLSQAKAQKLVDYYADQIKRQTEGAAETAEKWYAERKAAETAERIEADLVALKADKEIGGQNFEPVKAQVMEFVGTLPIEFRKMVDKQGLSNNPEFVRAFHRAIHYIPQDRGERPAGGGGGRTIEQRMYPT